MNTPQFALAITALLAAPGPTNALLALAGARRGVLSAWPLIVVVTCAYLAVIIPLLLWGTPMIHALPVLKQGLAGVAALWVAWLAIRLWRMPVDGVTNATEVTARALAVTTLLNPKALLIGLVLLPDLQNPGRGLSIFATILPAVSLLWVTLGAGVLSRAGRWLNRGSALWLAAISLFLAVRALTA